MKPNPSTMKTMRRIPQPQSVQVDDPERSQPIYGAYSELGIEGADHDIECAAWGDNEMPVRVIVKGNKGED